MDKKLIVPRNLSGITITVIFGFILIITAYSLGLGIINTKKDLYKYERIATTNVIVGSILGFNIIAFIVFLIYRDKLSINLKNTENVVSNILEYATYTFQKPELGQNIKILQGLTGFNSPYGAKAPTYDAQQLLAA